MGQKSLQKPYDLNTPQNGAHHDKISTPQTFRPPTFQRRTGVWATAGALRVKPEGAGEG